MHRQEVISSLAIVYGRAGRNAGLNVGGDGSGISLLCGPHLFPVFFLQRLMLPGVTSGVMF